MRHLAIHPRRRHGPNHFGWRRGTNSCRSIGRHGLLPAGAPRCSGDLRIIRIIDVDGNWRTDVRDTRTGDCPVHRRCTRPPTRRPVPLGWLTDRIEAA